MKAYQSATLRRLARTPGGSLRVLGAIAESWRTGKKVRIKVGSKETYLLAIRPTLG